MRRSWSWSWSQWSHTEEKQRTEEGQGEGDGWLTDPVHGPEALADVAAGLGHEAAAEAGKICSGLAGTGACDGLGFPV